MNIDTLIKGVSDGIGEQLAKRGDQAKIIEDVRASMIATKREIANDVEADQVRAAKALIDSIDQDITERRARLDELKAEKASNEAA
ncbi:MAG: hypothetical protein HY829_10695, partial [Actinobacteria bacterium]|nr:hypothetical protein [Actinomycetota bacterium]